MRFLLLAVDFHVHMRIRTFFRCMFYHFDKYLLESRKVIIVEILFIFLNKISW